MNYKSPKIIKPKNGRRIATGNIHGCLNTFKELVKKINLEQNDQLFLLGDLIDNIERNDNVIYLDNGCVYKNNEDLGNLVGLDIDTKELFIQKNID